MTAFGVRPRMTGSRFFPVPKLNIVPRERVYPPPPVPPPVRLPAEIIDLAARRERDIQAAYAAGFRAAELKYGGGDSRHCTMRSICIEVAKKYGFTLADLRSERRRHDLVVARHEAMWRCYHETKSSFPAIGRVLGNRDHTTVMNGVRKHEERMAEAKQAEGT